MTRRGSIDALAARLTGLYDAREARSIALAAVAELSGLSPSALLTDPEAELAVEGLEESAARLAAGEPLQYVVGHTEFYGRRFAVREGVLIPRPETEELVDAILHGEREARRLLDVGTGSGCIAASLALGMPGTEVFAADISDDALTVAAENFQQLGAAVTLREPVGRGHKFALRPIRAGEAVVKYDMPIGHATADIPPGSFVHTHNLRTNLSGELEYAYRPLPPSPLPEAEKGRTFFGYRRADGTVGIRNDLWIIPTVGCVNKLAENLARDFERHALLRLPAPVRLLAARRRP